MTEKNKPVSLDEARAVIAQHEADARAAAEVDQRAQRAERARQDERRRRWAETYAAQAGATLKEMHAARRTAEQRFKDTLAAEPWVQAMIEWQAASNEVAAHITRAGHARHTIGATPSIDERPGLPLIEYVNGQPAFPQLWRMLGDILSEHVPYRPMAEVDELIAAQDGPGDPLTA